jgi:hypothetical protein
MGHSESKRVRATEQDWKNVGGKANKESEKARAQES